jgi:hypothetical protein
LAGVRLPYCANSYLFPVLVFNGPFLVEKGDLSLNTSSFQAEALTLVPLAPSSQVSSALNSLTLQFVHSTVIPRNSYFRITLPPKADLTGSTCVFTGLEATAACTVVGGTKNVITVNNLSVLGERNSNSPITIRLNQFANPKGRGVYPVKLELLTSSDCLYASGTETLEITQIPALEQVSLNLPSAFRNIFLRYTFEVTPNTASWDAGDYILIEFPDTHFISETPSCAFLSLANLNSITCTRLSSLILKVVLGVKPAGYALDRKLSFYIDYVRNSNNVGVQNGYIVKLVDSASNSEFEIHSTTSKEFANLSAIESSDAEFETTPVGELYGSLRLTFKSEHFLEKDTRFEVRYTQKFGPLQQVALKSSSPPMTLLTVDPALRKVTLKLDSAQPPGTRYLCSLTSPNPRTMELGTSDLELHITTPTQFQVTSFFPNKSVKLFTCTANCFTCAIIHSQCTSCSDKFLLKDTVCEPVASPIVIVPSKRFQFEPSYAFLGVAALLLAWMLISGLFCGSRNYWGNLLFALIQFNFTGFGGWYAYKLYTTEGLEDLFKYLLCGAAAFHFLLSALYLCNLHSLLKTCKYSQRFSADGGPESSQSETPHEAIVTKVEIDAQYIGLKKILLALTPLFSPAVLRWLYSEKAGKRGFFWYLERETFFKVRSKLEVFQLLHFMFTTLPLAAINAYLTAPIQFEAWQPHIAAMLALCSFQFLVYLLAFGELCSAREKLQLFHAADPGQQPKHKIVSGNVQNSILFEQKSALLDQSVDEQALLRKKTPKIVTKSILDIEARNNTRHQGSQTQLNKASNLFQKPREGSSEGLFSSQLQDCRTANKELQVDDTQGLEQEVNNFEFQLPGPGDVTPLPPRMPAKKRKSIEVALQRDGVFRPVLPPQTASKREDYRVSWADRVDEQAESENARPIVWKDEHGDKFYKYESVKLDLGVGALKKPGDNKFRENQLFSKWWFTNSSQRYLEIIYEEDEDGQKFYQPESSDRLRTKVGDAEAAPRNAKAATPQLASPTPDLNYIQATDNLSEKISTVDLNNHLRRPQLTDTIGQYPSKQATASKKRFSTPNADIPEYELLNLANPKDSKEAIRATPLDAVPIAEKEHLTKGSKAPLLNGQKLSDLNRGVLKDRNEQALILDRQPLLGQGVLKLEGKTVALNQQEEGTFSLGLIRDNEGKVYRLKDQDLELLSQGVFLDQEGRVDNINGQKPADLDRQVVVDRAGRQLDLGRQPDDCWETNTFFLNDFETVTFQEPQDKDKLRRGLLRLPGNKEIRLKDQYLADIIRYQQYRDRNLELIPPAVVSLPDEPPSDCKDPEPSYGKDPEPSYHMTPVHEEARPSEVVVPFIPVDEQPETISKVDEATSLNMEMIPSISRTPRAANGLFDSGSQQQSNYNGVRQFAKLDSLEKLGQKAPRHEGISQFDAMGGGRELPRKSLEEERRQVDEEAPDVEDSEANEDDDQEEEDRIRNSILNSVADTDKFKKPKNINWAKTSSVDEIFEKQAPLHSLEDSPAFNQFGPMEEAVKKRAGLSPRVYKESPIASARKQADQNNSFEFEEVEETQQEGFQLPKPAEPQLDYYDGPVRIKQTPDEPFGIRDVPSQAISTGDPNKQQLGLNSAENNKSANSIRLPRIAPTDERNTGFEIPEPREKNGQMQGSKSPLESGKDMRRDGSAGRLNPSRKELAWNRQEAEPVKELEDWEDNDAIMADLNQGYPASNRQSRQALPKPGSLPANGSDRSLINTNGQMAQNPSPWPGFDNKPEDIDGSHQRLVQDERPFTKQAVQSPEDFEWEDEGPVMNTATRSQPKLDEPPNLFIAPRKQPNGVQAPSFNESGTVGPSSSSKKPTQQPIAKSRVLPFKPIPGTNTSPSKGSKPNMNTNGLQKPSPIKQPSSQQNERIKAPAGPTGRTSAPQNKPQTLPHSSQNTPSRPTATKPKKVETRPVDYSKDLDDFFPDDEDEFRSPSPQRNAPRDLMSGVSADSRHPNHPNRDTRPNPVGASVDKNPTQQRVSGPEGRHLSPYILENDPKEYSRKPTEGKKPADRSNVENSIRGHQSRPKLSSNEPKRLKKVASSDEESNPFDNANELNGYTPNLLARTPGWPGHSTAQHPRNSPTGLSFGLDEAPDTLPDKQESPSKWPQQPTPNRSPESIGYSPQKPDVDPRPTRTLRSPVPLHREEKNPRGSPGSHPKQQGSQPTGRLQPSERDARKQPSEQPPVREKSHKPANKQPSVSEENKTMYLEMLADQSFDMEFNIEEVDDNSRDEIPQPEIEIDGKFL